MIFPLDKIRTQLAKQATRGNEAVLDQFVAEDVAQWFPNGKRELQLPEDEGVSPDETGDSPPPPPTDKAALAKMLGVDDVQKVWREMRDD